MELELIKKLAKEAGLSRLTNPRILVDHGEFLKFETPPGLTIYGENVVKFANLIEAHLNQEKT